MTEDRGPLDLERRLEESEKYISEIKKDNLFLAKEVDRLNEYIQIMELENVGREKKNQKVDNGMAYPDHLMILMLRIGMKYLVKKKKKS